MSAPGTPTEPNLTSDELEALVDPLAGYVDENGAAYTTSKVDAIHKELTAKQKRLLRMLALAYLSA